ncbi:MAG TPA: hypothetical protein VL095_15560 [Flavisolibacter sp.]|nr:hypothetical protein [Flavisolibacter sp.]
MCVTRYSLLTGLMCFLFVTQLYAQKDTSLPQNRIDSFLSRQKGVLGQLAESLRADTTEEKEQDMQRGDKVFQKFNNRIIRLITVQSLDFGISLGDTSKRINNSLTHLANWLHNNTKERVIRHNLFFKPYDKVSAYLLANNERYLRNLPYIQDAKIVIRPVRNHPDSVDVTIFTKDVFSIGGSLRLHSYQTVSASVQDDNTLGWGDQLRFQTLFDQRRRPAFGYGMGYIKRNIAGSFIDLSAGYLNFSPAFNTGRREENTGFVRMEKPFVNPYSLWTWSASAELHSTSNMFGLDSVFDNRLKYKYRLFDGWIGRNLTTNRVSSEKEFSRFRFLVSLRLMDQKFLEKPLQFTSQYNYSFANTFAVLAGLSAYKQRFYKTSYIYGFGRHEDLPSGVEVSIVSGFTEKEARKRLYSALSFTYNYVTPKQRFFNYFVSAGSSFHRGKPEDVSMIGSIEYFGRLHQWNRWKQRIFFNASAAKQLNPLMDEPLYLESSYGLPGYKNEWVPGHSRISIKMESVFFSPLSIFYFRFAPFVFGNLAWFKTAYSKRTVPMIGGGIRCRNESLVLGTLELKGTYFLKEDLSGTKYSVGIRSNLRYKYNQNFIKKPQFVEVN